MGREKEECSGISVPVREVEEDTRLAQKRSGKPSFLHLHLTMKNWKAFGIMELLMRVAMRTLRPWRACSGRS